MTQAGEKWKWFGTPGHLCVADRCRFHLCTKVGRYLVSTVGEYYPTGAKKPEEIGINRLYETFVFKAGKPCTAKDCGCGLPEINGIEIDSLGYNDRKSANEGHMKLCRKYARKK